MSISISPSANKSALKSHAWLGLAVSVLMYWVCFSGTLSVFSQELLRWEQPHIADNLDYTPSSIQNGNIVIRLPTHDLPRARISADDEYWNISPTGELSEPSTTPITDLIVDLHTALHLPEELGMMVVSVLGAILSALIISGIVAHRRIFKDAFRLRTGNNEQLTQGDLHNRMSVWGLPFHLMIALTGVYFGLASFLTSIYADTLYEGNDLDLFADIYGSSIQLEHQPAIANIEKALTDIMKMEPNTPPIFVTLENATKDNQYILLGSQHLDISVTGINLWLAKRSQQDALNQLWLGFVWGTPIAFIWAALLELTLALPTKPVFWITLVAILIGSLMQKVLTKTHLMLLNCLATLLVVLAITHFVVHYPSSLVMNSLIIDSAFIVFALCVWRYLYSRLKKGWNI